MKIIFKILDDLDISLNLILNHNIAGPETAGQHLHPADADS